MTSTVTFSEAPTTGLGKLLTENRFFVPTHQRDYSWDVERVEKLFDDLVESMDRGDEFYFIGLMVFMRSSDDRLRVLDGQQRLATALIIFSSIRAWFGSVDGGNDTSGSIQRDFIGRSEYGETEVRPKLSLNINNDAKFQRYVVTGSPLSEVKKEVTSLNRNAPNYDLLSSIVYCHERIAKITETAADESHGKAYLIKLVKFIRDSVVVVRLTVPTEANAFRVFETLNDRGLDLSAVDLIKNYLFGIAYEASPSQLQQVENRWSQLTHQLTDVSDSDFLRVYWTSRYGRTQLDDIFEEVRRSVKTGSQAETITEDLLEAAEHYTALDDCDDPVWSSYSKETRDKIRALHILGSKQVRPVILAAINRFSVTEFQKLVWLLEVITVRWQVIGGRRTGAIEIGCARLAERIWNSGVTTTREARETLANLYVSDGDFRTSFVVKAGLTNQKTIYLLRMIESEERKRTLSSIALELAPAQGLSVEHIFPKTPSSEWNQEITSDRDLQKDCTLRLGNTCLLTPPHNREAARRGFLEKKDVYSSSSLLSTRRISTYETWGRDSIESHQTWLASRAVDVWRYN